MRKLGLALPDYGANQAAFLAIAQTNLYLSENYETDIIGFYENLTKPCLVPNFATMQAVEMWGYDGPVIATSLNLAQDMVHIPTLKDRYFYIWDLEWIHLEDKEYSKLKTVYCNPELKLVTRSQDYAKIIENVWNRKVEHIVEDFDIKELVNLTWNQH